MRAESIKENNTRCDSDGQTLIHLIFGLESPQRFTDSPACRYSVVTRIRPKFRSLLNQLKGSLSLQPSKGLIE
ncbi:hypothetical protein CEXT_210961 [Caerostris extrusa]|uniref:Uncharacterized protein n=1 Tax=Caerostris extrusa TaxID=172846 RepID=A0AAV4M6Q4_CAEEX|nr:hypothetical protein CEXT_210961 [Caerostris extrusa]